MVNSVCTHKNVGRTVFIDAANLWEAQKAKGMFLDYEKTRMFLREYFHSQNISVFYYTAYPREGTRSYSVDSKHRFYTFLKKGLGFTVRKKELKQITVETEAGQTIREKGNMDVEMTIDALHHKDHYDVAVFFTGDSDFLALISYLRQRGKKIFIFSSRNNVSQELRTGSNGYVDVLEIQADIWGPRLKRRAQ